MALTGTVKVSDLGSGKILGSTKGSWLPRDNVQSTADHHNREALKTLQATKDKYLKRIAEIDRENSRIRARLGIAESAPDKLKIWITLDGGLVQNVETTQPATVYKFDFDIDGADLEDLVKSLDGKSDCYFFESEADILTVEQQAEREDWLINQL